MFTSFFLAVHTQIATELNGRRGEAGLGGEFQSPPPACWHVLAVDATPIVACGWSWGSTAQMAHLRRQRRKTEHTLVYTRNGGKQNNNWETSQPKYALRIWFYFGLQLCLFAFIFWWLSQGLGGPKTQIGLRLRPALALPLSLGLGLGFGPCNGMETSKTRHV